MFLSKEILPGSGGVGSPRGGDLGGCPGQVRGVAVGNRISMRQDGGGNSTAALKVSCRNQKICQKPLHVAVFDLTKQNIQKKISKRGNKEV